jgi:hypothetical protein
MLLEPSPAEDADNNANDENDTDDSGSCTSDVASAYNVEAFAGRHRSFTRCRAKLEKNLHVLHPSVRSVMQLSQTMLGGTRLIDFTGLQYVINSVFFQFIIDTPLFSRQTDESRVNRRVYAVYRLLNDY